MKDDRPFAFKNLRWIVGGFLFGFGFTNFFLFILLYQFWQNTGLQVPDPSRGIIYEFTDKMGTVYISLFQKTALTLLRGFSIPISLLAMTIMPHEFKLLPRSRFQLIRGRFETSPANKPDFGLFRGLIGASGFIASPIIAYYLGHPIVDFFNNLF